MNSKTLAKSFGFTLIELLTVLAIIVIVIGLVAPIGWKLAFEFSSQLLVPALGVSAGAAHITAVLLSIGVLVVGLAILAMFGKIVVAICTPSRRR